MLKMTSKLGRKAGLGLAEGLPVYCLSGVRHEGGESPIQALVWNVRTCRLMHQTFVCLMAGGPQAAGTVRGRVPFASTGTDRLVVAVMPGNSGGAKETNYRDSFAGQPFSDGRNS